MSTPDFVRNSGASVVSNNVLQRRAPLRWLVREESNPADNGGWPGFRRCRGRRR